MRVLAVDPGRTCGVAEWSTAGGFERSFEDGADDVVDLLEEWMGDTTLLVVERADLGSETLRRSRDDVLHMIETIGALKYLARVYCVEVEMGSRNKKVCSDDVLRRAGMYLPTDGGHANDASRLLIRALHRRGLLKELP